jgi:hypothetical protein
MKKYILKINQTCVNYFCFENKKSIEHDKLHAYCMLCDNTDEYFNPYVNYCENFNYELCDNTTKSDIYECLYIGRYYFHSRNIFILRPDFVHLFIIPYVDRILPHSTFFVYLFLFMSSTTLLFIPLIFNCIFRFKILYKEKKLINLYNLATVFLTFSHSICMILSLISMLARERVKFYFILNR